jgi:hypothetical protein
MSRQRGDMSKFGKLEYVYIAGTGRVCISGVWETCTSNMRDVFIEL